MQTLGSKIINEILKHEKINANTFAERIGLKRTQPIYDLQNGKVKKITPNYANKILNAFPYYDYTWLLTGEGEMLTNTTPSSGNLFVGNSNKNVQMGGHGSRTMFINESDSELKNKITELEIEIVRLTGQLAVKDETIKGLKNELVNKNELIDFYKKISKIGEPD